MALSATSSHQSNLNEVISLVRNNGEVSFEFNMPRSEET